jgi:transposase, IS5 family
MRFFEHEMPIDPSSMSRWRRRIGEAGAEELLRETLDRLVCGFRSSSPAN